MPICCSALQLMEVLVVPKVLEFGRFIIYFWSNENGEPIHVHVAEKTPSANATKIWLTKKGKCILAHNNGRIPNRELGELCEVIEANFFIILSEWKEHFCVEEVSFYC